MPGITPNAVIAFFAVQFVALGPADKGIAPATAELRNRIRAVRLLERVFVDRVLRVDDRSVPPIVARCARGQSPQRMFFESFPGHYVTGNLYLPHDPPKPLPTILYLCGHAPHPAGAKFNYQDRAAWFAANAGVQLHGAIYAGVRAAVDRAGAAGVGRAVGDWHPRHLTDRLSHSAANGHRVA